MALIVNIFGSSNSNKTKIMREVVNTLKSFEIDVEEINDCDDDAEFGHWNNPIAYPFCFYGEQYSKQQELAKPENVIITDSPLLLCNFFGDYFQGTNYPLDFHNFVVNQTVRSNSINFMILQKPVDENPDQIEFRLKLMFAGMNLHNNFNYYQIDDDRHAVYNIVYVITTTLFSKYKIGLNQYRKIKRKLWIKNFLNDIKDSFIDRFKL